MAHLSQAESRTALEGMGTDGHSSPRQPCPSEPTLLKAPSVGFLILLDPPPLSWDAWLSAQHPPRSRWQPPVPTPCPACLSHENGGAGQTDVPKLAWLGSVDSRTHPHQVPRPALDKQPLVGASPSCGLGPSEPCPSCTHGNRLCSLLSPCPLRPQGWSTQQVRLPSSLGSETGPPISK